MRSGLWCLVILVLVAPAFAAPEIDQACLPQIWGGYSILVGGPIGQEFVPTHLFVTTRVDTTPWSRMKFLYR